MFRVKTFNAVQAGRNQVGDDVVVVIEAGMGEDSDTARLMDQGDGIDRGDFEFGNPCRPALAEKSFEGLVEAGTPAALHQRPRHVWSSR